MTEVTGRARNVLAGEMSCDMRSGRGWLITPTWGSLLRTCSARPQPMVYAWRVAPHNCTSSPLTVTGRRASSCALLHDPPYPHVGQPDGFRDGPE